MLKKHELDYQAILRRSEENIGIKILYINLIFINWALWVTVLLWGDNWVLSGAGLCSKLETFVWFGILTVPDCEQH